MSLLQFSKPQKFLFHWQTYLTTTNYICWHFTFWVKFLCTISWRRQPKLCSTSTCLTQWNRKNLITLSFLMFRATQLSVSGAQGHIQQQRSDYTDQIWGLSCQSHWHCVSFSSLPETKLIISSGLIEVFTFVAEYTISWTTTSINGFLYRAKLQSITRFHEIGSALSKILKPS